MGRRLQRPPRTARVRAGAQELFPAHSWKLKQDLLLLIFTLAVFKVFHFPLILSPTAVILISFLFLVPFHVTIRNPRLDKPSLSSALVPALSIPQLLLLFGAFCCGPANPGCCFTLDEERQSWGSAAELDMEAGPAEPPGLWGSPPR